MRIFLTGANGFIGGAVAARLMADGHQVRGLVRDAKKAAAVSALGITPVIGSLDDAALLTREAQQAEGVVNAADSDHRVAIEALVAGLAGSGKPLLHTSGSSIIADEAMGEPSDRVFREDEPFVPEPDKAPRVALDRFVLNAPGVRSVVLCNTMIYGAGRGVTKESDQVPTLAAQARASGIPRHIGRGLNRWSNVHIDDVTDLYARALSKAEPGTFMYVESSEESLGAVVGAIAVRLGLGPAEAWPAEAAIAEWGRMRAVFGFGSNSRVRGKRARAELGWSPKRNSVTEWILNELPQ